MIEADVGEAMAATMKNNGPKNRLIDRDKLIIILDSQGRTQVWLADQIGMDVSKFRQYLLPTRTTGFTDQVIDSILKNLGDIPYEDIALVESRPSRSRTEKENSPHVLKRSDMTELYSGFTTGHFVSVFSSEEFIEDRIQAFFNVVIGAVKRGLEIFYFFPEGAAGKAPNAHFDSIYKKMTSSLSEDAMQRVKGFYIDGSKDICSRASSFVLLGKKDAAGSYEVDEMYLYISTRGGEWIRLDAKECKEFVADLEAAIDRVPHIPIDLQRKLFDLPPLIVNPYRTSFTSGGKEYENIRHVVKTEETAKRIANIVDRHLSRLPTFEKAWKIIQAFDIGAEDGKNTATFFNELTQNGYRVAMTAVDTSVQHDPDPLMKFSPFFDGIGFEELDNKLKLDIKFDVIISIHTWYVINPIDIMRAYRRLNPNGILVVTLGPLGSYNFSKSGSCPEGVAAGNFLNVLCAEVDAAISLARGDNRKAYTGKIATDPYRNYAEDIHEAIKTMFFEAPGSVHTVVTNRLALASEVLDESELTQHGKAMVDFFCHGHEVAEKSLLYENVFTTLSEIKTKKVVANDQYPDRSKIHLPASEVDFIIVKGMVGSTLEEPKSEEAGDDELTEMISNS